MTTTKDTVSLNFTVEHNDETDEWTVTYPDGSVAWGHPRGEFSGVELAAIDAFEAKHPPIPPEPKKMVAVKATDRWSIRSKDPDGSWPTGATWRYWPDAVRYWRERGYEISLDLNVLNKEDA